MVVDRPVVVCDACIAHMAEPEAPPPAAAMDDPDDPDELAGVAKKPLTAEEKKARKAAVKLGRREARAAKKGLKTTFKQEQAEMSKKRPTGDVRQGLSVRVIE